MIGKILKLLSILLQKTHMKNVNECLKRVDLGPIFRNILWKNNKIINLSESFYIFYESGIKNFPNIAY